MVLDTHLEASTADIYPMGHVHTFLSGFWEGQVRMLAVVRGNRVTYKDRKTFRHHASSQNIFNSDDVFSAPSIPTSCWMYFGGYWFRSVLYFHFFTLLCRHIFTRHLLLKSQQQNLTLVSSFKHLVSLVCQKSRNLLEQICAVPRLSSTCYTNLASCLFNSSHSQGFPLNCSYLA